MSNNAGHIYRVRNWDHYSTSDIGQLNLHNSSRPVVELLLFEDDSITLAKTVDRFQFSLGRQPKGKETVALMLCLGEEPIDEDQPGIDLEVVMKKFGWVRANV